MLNKARIHLELPTRGTVWLFIDPQLTVEQFKDMCTAEDEQVQSLEVFDGGKTIAPSQSLHSVLTDVSK